MKKNIKLYMMLALVMLLCLALPGFSALADESDITSLEATADETSVSVSGTTDEAVLAIMVEVVDSKGNTVDYMSFPVNSENTFSGILPNLELISGEEYKVRAANFAGGAWCETTCIVESASFGSKEITRVAAQYIYAYARLDFDADGDADDDDLKYALTYDLYDKVVAMNLYGRFGIADDIKVDDKLTNIDAIRHGIYKKIKGFEKAGTITATATGGDEATIEIPRYKVTIDWGVDEETGEAVIGDVYLYEIPDLGDILVCTDYTSGTTDNFFLTRTFSEDGDWRNIIVDGEGDSVWNNGLAAHVIIASKIGNVVCGGHGVKTTVMTKDSELYVFSTIPSNMCDPGTGEGGLTYRPDGKAQNETEVININTEFKVVLSTGRYFVVLSEGEKKAYDFVSDDAGNPCDKLWQAGSDKPVKVFIHDNILRIKPLVNNLGIGTTAIASVSLADKTHANAVEIKQNGDDFTVTFKSNFYDSEKLIIKYAGDDKEYPVLIEREGILVQYTGTNGDKNSMNWGRDMYGGPDNGPSFTYDSSKNENFVVVATYYHSSKDKEAGLNDYSLVITYEDDGTTEIISHLDEAHNFNGYADGDMEKYGNGTAVDSTSFIIGFMPELKEDFEFERTDLSGKKHTGGIYLSIIRTGSEDGSFTGAFAGSGKGKYWNGQIHWGA